MKKILFIFLLLNSLRSIAQDYKFSGDTLIMKSGAKFYKDDKIKLGYGSDNNKNFVYITTSPFSLDPNQKISSSYANLTMVIKETKVMKNKRFGDKVYLILKGPGFLKLWCDIESAIDQGEVKL